jgi:hypothetical protein
MEKLELVLQGARFSISKRSLIMTCKLLDDHPELFAAREYQVQSPVDLNVFQAFLKSFEPNRKLIVTSDNVESVLLLANKFLKVDLVSECSRIRGERDAGPSSSIPESNSESLPIASGDYPFNP